MNRPKFLKRFGRKKKMVVKGKRAKLRPSIKDKDRPRLEPVVARELTEVDKLTQKALERGIVVDFDQKDPLLYEPLGLRWRGRAAIKKYEFGVDRHPFQRGFRPRPGFGGHVPSPKRRAAEQRAQRAFERKLRKGVGKRERIMRRRLAPSKRLRKFLGRLKRQGKKSK